MALLVKLLSSVVFIATLLLTPDGVKCQSRPSPSNTKSSQEILNDIVNFGLDRTRYLVEVLERKIYENGLALKKTDPAHFVAVFNKQTAKAKDLARYGYATLEASALLTKQ